MAIKQIRFRYINNQSAHYQKTKKYIWFWRRCFSVTMSQIISQTDMVAQIQEQVCSLEEVTFKNNKNHTAGGYGCKVGNNTVIRVHCVETTFSLQSLQYLLRYLSLDQSGGATDRQQANTSVPRAEFFMFSERESHPCQPARIKHCYIMFPSTSLPAATHSKVRLNNMHFNALQKNTQRLFSSLSVLPLKEATAGDVTWLGNDDNFQHSQLHTHTITHTYWSSILSSSLMCQMKWDVRWELNPATANQHISS